MAVEESGSDSIDGPDPWYLMRVTPPRPEVGLPLHYPNIRELTEDEWQAFEDATATVGAFGAGWGHYKLVDAAKAVSDAIVQLAANAKAAGGEGQQP